MSATVPRPLGELGRFLLVGLAGTAAYLLVYVVLREELPAHAANITARVGVAVPTTWLNGRHTFRSRVSWRRLVGGSLVVLAVSTAISSSLLAVEQARVGTADRDAELVVLVVANALATVARFVLLRHWLFRTARHAPPAPIPPAPIPPAPIPPAPIPPQLAGTTTPKRYA